MSEEEEEVEEEKAEIKVKLEIIKKPALTYIQREEIYENTVMIKPQHKLQKHKINSIN